MPNGLMRLTQGSRRTLAKRSLAWGMALTMICPPAAGLMPPAQAQTAAIVPQSAAAVDVSAIHTILLFPFSNAIPASTGTGGLSADTLGGRLEDAVKFRLNVIGRYKADSFSPALPQVQRALQEARIQGLTQADIAPPYDASPKGQKISALVGTDGYLLGSIDALSADPTSRTVTLTASAILYDTATGSSVKVIAHSGKGVSYNAGDNPDGLLQSAINDVAGQIVSALNSSAPREAPMTGSFSRGSRSNGGSILLGILLATAVGFAISSSNHHSGGGSSNTSSGGGTTGGGTGMPPVPNPPSP